MPEPPAELEDLPAAEAVPRLLDAFGGRIYRLGLAQCGSHQDAEDLVQETFLLAFRKWESFQGRSQPSTWLYTIAARACRRRRRRRAGEPQRLESLSALLPSGELRVPEIAAPEEDPLGSRLREEAGEAVRQALAALPASFRLPLVLKDLAELKGSEVSRILGLKEATVKTRVHRGRLLLRRYLAERLPGRKAPPANHSRRVCLDLLRSKQEALDRGVTSAPLERELCSRCQALFATLDLAQDVCRELGRGEMPPHLAALVREELAAETAAP